jgi:hypothetical protein
MKDMMNALSEKVMNPPVDVEKMDIDDGDGDDDESRVMLDWMVNVANEGRIEGGEVTGNADLLDHIHHHHHLLVDTAIRTDRERALHFRTNFGSSFDSLNWLTGYGR